MLPRKKPAKGRSRLPMTVTLPADLIERLTDQADQENRTRSKIIELATRAYLAEAERKAA
jgi:metal-responsive CopG/Arc/MetJ family transcriptional regulator